MEDGYRECKEGADQMITERTEMLKTALEHYHFKLTKLVDVENYNSDDPLNVILGEDMSLNISKVSDAILLMGTDGVQQPIRQYKNVLCCALINYIAALETSKKDISEKLAGAKPNAYGYSRTLIRRQVYRTLRREWIRSRLIC